MTQNQQNRDFLVENSAAAELSLADIANFLSGSWKKLAIAALMGIGLGFAGWFLLGKYSAEYVLLNNAYGLDLVSWKTIQKKLPNLAAQIVEDGKAPEGQVGLYRAFASDQWWQKNVIPSYALSKADTKDLAGAGKDFDRASTTILSFVVSSDDATKESAINSVRVAAQFLRTGGAYLQLRSMLNGYEGEVISLAAEVQSRMTSTQIEMGYQQKRVKFLEELFKRYPGNSNVGQQALEFKESGLKYLSITTQIIAANNDINQSKEDLSKMDDRLVELALTKAFLDEALPAAENTLDGMILDKELQAIEAKLRAKIGKDAPRQQEMILDQIRSQLLVIQARFTKGLEAKTAPTSSGKKGMMKSIAGGAATAFFLMLMVLVGQKVWMGIKRE